VGAAWVECGGRGKYALPKRDRCERMAPPLGVEVKRQLYKTRHCGVTLALARGAPGQSRRDACAEWAREKKCVVAGGGGGGGEECNQRFYEARPSPPQVSSRYCCGSPPQFNGFLTTPTLSTLQPHPKEAWHPKTTPCPTPPP